MSPVTLMVSLFLLAGFILCQAQQQDAVKSPTVKQSSPSASVSSPTLKKELKEKTTVFTPSKKVSTHESKNKQGADLAEEYYRQGIVAYIQGDDAKALVCFQKALQIRPDHSMAKTRREKLQQETDEKKIKNANEKYNQGLALYIEGNLQKARALWEEALILEPYNPKIQKALDRVRAELREQNVP